VLGVELHPLAELAEVGPAFGKLRTAPPLHGLALSEQRHRSPRGCFLVVATFEIVEHDACGWDIAPEHVRPALKSCARLLW
jgi:hypothetical protein